MNTTKNNVNVYEGLALVTIEGYRPAEDEMQHLDAPGTANWFVAEYGQSCEPFDPENDGILWTDYDAPGWKFDVLIDAREVDAMIGFAKERNYEVIDNVEVSEPCVFGDGGGTVEILKHREGWVVLS